MSAARWSAAGVLASDGNIYVIGGRGATATTFTTVEAYNPTTDIWTSRAPLPAGRSALAAVATADGKIYAIGGTEDGSNMLDTVYVYDLNTNTWDVETPLLTARGSLGGAYVDGTIYAIGGYDTAGNASDAVEATGIVDEITYTSIRGTDRYDTAIKLPRPCSRGPSRRFRPGVGPRGDLPRSSLRRSAGRRLRRPGAPYLQDGSGQQRESRAAALGAQVRVLHRAFHRRGGQVRPPWDPRSPSPPSTAPAPLLMSSTT